MGRSGPFFTGFLTHSGAMGLRIRRKLSSLVPIFAIDAPSPTGSQRTGLLRQRGITGGAGGIFGALPGLVAGVDMADVQGHTQSAA